MDSIAPALLTAQHVCTFYSSRGSFKNRAQLLNAATCLLDAYGDTRCEPRLGNVLKNNYCVLSAGTRQCLTCRLERGSGNAEQHFVERRGRESSILLSIQSGNPALCRQEFSSSHGHFWLGLCLPAVGKQMSDRIVLC